MWRREGRGHGHGYARLLFSRFFTSEPAISTSTPSFSSPSPYSASLHSSTVPSPSSSSSSSSKWIVLPAVPPAKGIARLIGQTELSAHKWLTRCCPEISHNNIEKLFRTRKVRLYHPRAESNDTGQLVLKRIARKAILSEGSILYLPKFVIQAMETKESLSCEVGDKKKATKKGKKHKLSTDDIEWAQELILHKDKYVIAINKPPGLPVQGGVGVGRSLDDIIGPAYSFNNAEAPKLVHRLDRETSGIMILGRTQESAAILNEMFRSKTSTAISSGCKDSITDSDNVIKRKYWALVIGEPAKKSGRIIAPLKKVVLDGGKSETIVIAKGIQSEDVQEAITEYRVMGPSIRGCTWLELLPQTGRKHQLRVHCAQALGTPILGDYKYGRKVHEEWHSNGHAEGDALEKNVVTSTSKTTRRRNVTLPDVKGSITSEKPFLHLHSRLIAIPKVKELNKKHESKEKLCFMDNLRLFAPLPPHMKSSWTILPPKCTD